MQVGLSRKSLSPAPWFWIPSMLLGAVVGITGIALVIIALVSVSPPISGEKALLLGFGGASIMCAAVIMRLSSEIQALRGEIATRDAAARQAPES
jgi:hypothetical protein